jgi:hypothetical protein
LKCHNIERPNRVAKFKLNPKLLLLVTNDAFNPQKGEIGPTYQKMRNFNTFFV